MATEIWLNIGLGNGLLPDGTKPLHEPMLTYNEGSLWHSPDDNFTSAQEINIDQMNLKIKHNFKIIATSPMNWTDTLLGFIVLWFLDQCCQNFEGLRYYWIFSIFTNAYFQDDEIWVVTLWTYNINLCYILTVCFMMKCCFCLCVV